MSEELAVTNARVITPTGRVDGGVQIEDGRITAVGSPSMAPVPIPSLMRAD